MTNLPLIISYMTYIWFLWMATFELIMLITNYYKWIYVEWKEIHSQQHIAILLSWWAIVTFIAITCEASGKLPLLLISWYFILFLLRHLRNERVETSTQFNNKW